MTERNCLHEIVMDMQNPPGGLFVRDNSDWWRLCAFCKESYNRTQKIIIPLRKRCEKAWAIDFKRLRLSDKDAIDIAS